MNMKQLSITVTEKNLKMIKSIIRSEEDVHNVSGAARFCIEQTDASIKTERKAVRDKKKAS